MPRMGFRADGDENVYVYLESKGGSAVVGIDAADSNRLKIDASTTTGINPDSSPMAIFDPRTDSTSGAGDITFIPKTQTSGGGTTGEFIITQGHLVVSELSTGVVQTDSLGTFSSTKGTDAQFLIGNSSSAPAWGLLTSPLGTITINYNAPNIEIDGSGTGLIQGIQGNSGIATPMGGVVNIETANTNVKFVGAVDTLTLDFGASSNLLLGDNGGGLSTGTSNTSVGQFALNNADTTVENIAMGFQALNGIASNVGFNTAIGHKSLGDLSDGGSGRNTALGWESGIQLGDGSYNTFLGYSAGSNYTSSESSNISINNTGTVGDSHTLRIGSATGTGTQQLNKAFICGIDGVNVGSVAKVLTMASDQLGTATITAGANITVTPSGNAITIATSGITGFSWATTAGGTASVNTGYFTNNGASLVTITLPATAAVGDTIRISGLAAGGWLMAQNAGQSVNIGSSSTTVGVGGSLASTARYDTIEIVCCIANTTFNVVSSMGNITIV